MTKKSKGVEQFCLQYLAKYDILEMYQQISVPRKVGTLHHRRELPRGGSLN